jgi:predicted Kef-type K+ transport protein
MRSEFFLAASARGLITWRLRLPLILGFEVGGIVISPFTPGLDYPTCIPSKYLPMTA